MNDIPFISNLLRRLDGPLTQQLVREPGKYGLGQTPTRLMPDATTRMVCGFCSTGCSLDVHLRGGEAINLTPTTDYPVNLGVACPKGWESLSVLDAPNRGTTPLARTNSGKLEPLDWPEALKLFCERMRDVQAVSGPASCAYLSTGQIPTEEMALLGAVAKFGLGMIHGDGNTRQCMATAATAYKQSYGFDAPGYTYDDFEQSDVIVLVGANLCVGHPIMWERVCRNPHQPKLIVIDPRRTETAAAAQQHLAIEPKSDLTLFYGLAKWLIDRGRLDHNFITQSTAGFEAFADHVAEFDLERVVNATGISASEFERFASTIANGKRVSFWWTMGVNQSHQGVRTAQSIINVALMTGNIGRAGAGANSITGQCNAMGSRIFSNTTSLFGGRRFESREDREEVAATLRLPVERIPDEPSWPYHRILEAIDEGSIRALWIVCTNPAHSWIQQDQIRERLQRLDFLVVQDLFHDTETAQLADLYLPAAGWGEKEGTFINSERRIGVVKRVRRAPGQALADFQIFKLIAEAWGCGEMFDDWRDPESVFRILGQLSRGTPCDFSGLRSYAEIDRAGGVQWPAPENLVVESQSQRRLFEDGRFYFPDGRARFLFEDPAPNPQAVSDPYPFTLLTGRGSVAQWHTQTRTANSSVLRKLHPQQAYVEIHPDDARSLQVKHGELVRLTSPWGQVELTAVVARSVQPSQLFAPMHFAEVNRLTHAHFDPYSHQPSYKNTAVRLTPVASGSSHGTSS